MKKAKRTGTGKYEQLMATYHKLSPVTAAMVYPCEDSALIATRSKPRRAGLVLGAPCVWPMRDTRKWVWTE